MSVYDNAAYEQHERVVHCNDPVSGLRAIIAIHSTALGPAGGGCRFWQYESGLSALTDVLRLSRGMSYKNAMAGLKMGGGKAVIMAPPDRRLTDDLLRAFGDFVDTLDGVYITAEDVGMSVGAMQIVAERTRYVAGLPRGEGEAGGDPSPKTADGVFAGIKAAVAFKHGKDSLDGLHVAVQGVGNVGLSLCRSLAAAGARLTVADINEARVRMVCEELGATAASLDEILTTQADVLAPCALGAILNETSIPSLNVDIVAGAANNQLATDEDGQRLFDAGIVYAPDYVINAGGIINVACEFEGGISNAVVDQRVQEIGARLATIFEQSAGECRPTNDIADKLAKQLIGRDIDSADLIKH
ncbi:MAG: Glu/Leu/Phe/Val dehydrogenase dimerization domain-containing protein [Pseudomonadota bacterium]